MSKMIDDVEHFFNCVVDFNMSAGAKDHPAYSQDWWSAVQLQCKLIVEESKEALEAADNKDSVEILKEAIDVLVTSFRLVDMLEKAGYDVNSAFNEVNDDNYKKVFVLYSEAVEAKEALEERDGECYHISSSFVDGTERYTVRRSDGKIMKTVDHGKICLEKWVPYNLA